MRCPECKSKKITNIPSSTMPIFDESKVDEKTLELHKSIKNICQNCLWEW